MLSMELLPFLILKLYIIKIYFVALKLLNVSSGNLLPPCPFHFIINFHFLREKVQEIVVIFSILACWTKLSFFLTATFPDGLLKFIRFRPATNSCVLGRSGGGLGHGLADSLLTAAGGCCCCCCCCCSFCSCGTSVGSSCCCCCCGGGGGVHCFLAPSWV